MIPGMGEGYTGERGQPPESDQPRWVARVVRIRTTHDVGGPTYGVATGMGATPQLALDELQREARTLAQKAAQEAVSRGEQPPTLYIPPGSSPTTRPAWQSPPPVSAPTARPAWEPPTTRPAWETLDYRFEVVDVRLTPALMEDGGSGWLAYGTLAHEAKLRAHGAGPQRASPTTRPASGYGGAPRVPGPG
jgi:hypothetical protein